MRIQSVFIGVLQAVCKVVEKDLEQHCTLRSMSIFVMRYLSAAGARLALNQRDTRPFAGLSRSLTMATLLSSVSLAYVGLYLRMICFPEATQGTVLSPFCSSNAQGRVRQDGVQEHLLAGVRAVPSPAPAGASGGHSNCRSFSGAGHAPDKRWSLRPFTARNASCKPRIVAVLNCVFLAEGRWHKPVYGAWVHFAYVRSEARGCLKDLITNGTWAR